MATPGCSVECCGTDTNPGPLSAELRVRWWVGVVLVAGSCALAYGAHSTTAWLWGPAALAAWYGTYQTVYSKGCSSCGAAAENDVARPILDERQRSIRRRMAHQFLVASAIVALLAWWMLPLLWPLAAIAGWFAASFYVAVWTRYVGCPEIGAIPSWIVGHPVATRCAPLERRDARAKVR